MPKYKHCIMDINKSCDDCGECDICDLNKNKKCDNCGKCLQDSFDMRGIKIDSIIDDEDENNSSLTENIEKNENENNSQCEFVGDDYTGPDFNEEDMELIDDIEGLKEILENEDKSKDILYEEFPGLIRIRKK
ncbi:hypothetical protein [Clostridium lundense]|uniref:hypothetical protein n=1 Tax=Clostridium lundense TaxID=319475 RepID=UPI000489405F|nr:hypothetical protein [Clostridium lundense]